ncbi:MAG: hypothetical protein JWQ83_1402 [Lacunisphaera sp.]|nr:hypothetical protein [Lacunisphaera sp.]
MKKTLPIILALSALALTACVFVPKPGMKETKWLKNTITSDLVYMQGDMKAYRANGAYYYFKGGKLVTVNQALLPVDRFPTGN